MALLARRSIYYNEHNSAVDYIFMPELAFFDRLKLYL